MKKTWLDNPNIEYIEKDGLGYLQFANLSIYKNIITHCFTTRNGGVSRDECSTLNMSFGRNDSRENVLENYRRVSKALGIKCENMVLSNQVHDNRIRIVDEKDRGKGIIRESDIIGFDGLATKAREVALVTFYADCVPVFFLDPIEKAIAVSHSGWRGTVKKIAEETVKVMSSNFGSRPENIVVAIGPSIGKCCFETGEEVYREFINKLAWSKEYCIKTGDEKWHINLQGIIKRTLENAGLREENICVADICTKCNKDTFFSHRGDNGRTGSLAAILQLI